MRRYINWPSNGDTHISEIIQDIYLKTDNPSIQFVKSKTNESFSEIIEGYVANISYLDSIFMNDGDKCNINKPILLMFDHKVEKPHFEHIISKLYQKEIDSDRRIVVIAPYYDKEMLDYIRQTINLSFKTSGTSKIVFCRVSLINNLSMSVYSDFAMLTGGTIITEHNVHSFITESKSIDDNKIRKSDKIIRNDSSVTNFTKINMSVDNFIGYVDYISIGATDTIIKGLHNINNILYNIYVNEAKSELKKIEECNQNLGIVDTRIYELKQRVSKLKCSMGILHVGGNSSIDKTANYDLVEDAVKACESAFNYGYNIGGSLIIPITIDKLTSMSQDETQDKYFKLIRKAFADVFIKVLHNKYKDEDGSMDESEIEHIAYMKTVDKCIDQKICFDLVNEYYSHDIINSCQTDIEILRAGASIVALLLSSNQYIFIRKE